MSLCSRKLKDIPVRFGSILLLKAFNIQKDAQSVIAPVLVGIIS